MYINDEDKKDTANSTLGIYYMGVLLILLLAVCGYQRYMLDDMGYGNKEYSEVRELCVEAHKEGIGCKVGFGPYAEFEQMEYTKEDER